MTSDAATEQAIIDRLRKIADSTSSNENDEVVIQRMLQNLGYPRAKVVYGIVYVNGSGHPMSVQQAARQLLRAFEMYQSKQPVVRKDGVVQRYKKNVRKTDEDDSIREAELRAEETMTMGRNQARENAQWRGL